MTTLELPKMLGYQKMKNESQPDFIIVSVLNIEHAAILKKLYSHQKLDPLGAILASISPEKGSPRGVALQVPNIGRIEAAVIVTKALHIWNPAVLLLVGLSGGFEVNSVTCGDVLIATEIIDFELQKATQSGREIRWRKFTPSPKLLDTAKETSQKECFGDRFRDTRVHFGPVFSGEKVIASKSFTQELQSWNKDALGVEMEGSGVATAVRHHDLEFLMVRGVADMADENKSDIHQERASNAAADFAIAVLANWFKI